MSWLIDEVNCYFILTIIVIDILLLKDDKTIYSNYSKYSAMFDIKLSMIIDLEIYFYGNN